MERLAPAKSHHGAKSHQAFAERRRAPDGRDERRSARLRSASLRFATLSGANLAGADLSGADLTDARLDGANLTDADLSHAVLNRTDFAGAKLAGARLDNSSLASARNLTQDQITESLGDRFTLLPSYLEIPVSWTEAAEEQSADGEAAEAPNVTTRGRGGTMSWLVGAPTPAEAHKLK